MPKKQKRLYLTLFIGSALTFIISALLASQKIIFPWEKHIILSIYDWPASLRPLALAITQFGSAWILVAVTLILLVGHKRSQHWGRMAVVNGGITYALVQASKHLIGRPRPAELINELHQRDFFVRGFGFPSGHTAIATVVSLTIIRYLPRRWRWVPIPWIVLVGLSRIYLGVHAPLDIVGGITIGVMVVSLERLTQIDSYRDRNHGSKT